MLAQRQIFRNAPRVAAQLRAPVLRSAVQRRFASNTASNTAKKNKFIEEREAVKAHAASTTG